MKKIVYIFAVLLFVSVKASAQNPQLIIDDCVAPIGGKVAIAVKYNTEGKNYSGVNFNIDLPEGLSYEVDSKGNVVATIDNSNSGFTPVTSSNGFAPFSATDYLAGETGTLLTFVLNVASNLSKDQELTCNVRNIAFTSAEGTKISLEPFTFVVKTSDKWVLDENSAALPVVSSAPVDILVKRTIKANQWSTICLPFDMTKAQVEEVFGSDVKIAFFDADNGGVVKVTGNPVESIEVEFKSYNYVDGLLYGCSPYLIRTSQDISEFEVKAQIYIDEEYLTAEYTAGSRPKKTYGFYGKLAAGTVIPENGLFLSGNEFWYSTGKTVMKGFRGYFQFTDVVPKSSSAKVTFIVDGEATSIDGMNIKYAVDGVYDLSGRKIQLKDGDLNKLQKGVYIIDGKKVTIK